MSRRSDVTRLLAACGEGERDAFDHLLPLLYDELHALADRQLHGERRAHTLQATALVNEAWLRLVDQRNRNWANRSHFLCIAATAMRRVLINYANRRLTAKRGGDRHQVTLQDASAIFEQKADDLLALDEALDRLAVFDRDKARLVELRFFAGLTAEEAAGVLEVSTRTVERGWRLAKAWLRRDMDTGNKSEAAT